MSIGEFPCWWDMRMPVLPAAFIETEQPLQKTTTFLDRLSALSHLILHDTHYLICILSSYWQINFVNISLSEFLSLPSRSSLFLYYWDNLMTGYALPKLPHVEFIGGVSARPAQKLKGNLKEWQMLQRMALYCAPSDRLWLRQSRFSRKFLTYSAN